MTAIEKHLREALAQAKFTFNEIDCTVDTPLAEKGMEDAENAKQEADLMQDEPDDFERLLKHHSENETDINIPCVDGIMGPRNDT